MKIYTKTGDRGETGVFGGPRVRKDHARIEAYGTVDELNAILGVARCEKAPPDTVELLQSIQNDLFDLGSELATPDPEKSGAPRIVSEQITALEAAIDRFEDELPPLKEFILPGGTPAAATLHQARTVCRRAERRVVSLSAEVDGSVSAQAMVYLNRLSDLLFVLARAANAQAKQPDVIWRKRT